MRLVHAAADLRDQVRAWRHSGARIAFVPTMGNLHAGHYSLVRQARAACDRVVASVFVNPTQFGPHEDFAEYPRTLEADRQGLAANQCDLLFAPTVEVMYPLGLEHPLRIEVPVVTETLDGRIRPGHFAGVATVVTKLLNLVQPDVAFFGQKDYQQLLVIRRAVVDLLLPVEIRAGATVREANGLAMSSRNQYLSDAQRQTAGVIYEVLKEMAAGAISRRETSEIEAAALDRLSLAGLAPDYAVLRRAVDLSDEIASEPRLVALIAARLGPTRLIDNLLIDLH